jgi:hypothetical protein
MHSSERKHVGGHEGFLYSFPDIRPGLHLLGVIMSDRVVATTTVTVRDRMVEKDLLVPAPRPEERSIVHVLGPDGRPLGGVRFTVRFRSERSHTSRGADVVRRADGSYRLRHQQLPASGRRQEGRHSVVAEHPRYGRKEVVYRPEDVPEITIRFEEPATIAATIGGFVSSPYAPLLSLRLLAAEDDDDPCRGETVRHGAARPDSEGTQSLGPVAPGEYVLALFVAMGRHSEIPVAHRRLRLRSGRNEVTLAIPRLHALTVRTGSDPVRVGLDRKGGGRFHVFPIEPVDGRVVFRGLPDGMYRLTSFGGKPRSLTVTLPGPTVVDLPE